MRKWEAEALANGYRAQAERMRQQLCRIEKLPASVISDIRVARTALTAAAYTIETAFNLRGESK